MKHLKMLGLAAVAAMGFTAFAAGSASASTAFEVNGEYQSSVFITASLKSGTSAVVSSTSGALANTCTSAHLEGTMNEFHFPTVTGNLKGLSFSSCERAVVVDKAGILHVLHLSGTDGTLTSSGAEVTVGSPVGTLNCKTGAGVDLGTLTGTDGSPSTHAEMHINAVLNCGFLLPSASWKGTYTVTTPTKLGVFTPL